MKCDFCHEMEICEDPKNYVEFTVDNPEYVDGEIKLKICDACIRDVLLESPAEAVRLCDACSRFSEDFVDIMNGEEPPATLCASCAKRR